MLSYLDRSGIPTRIATAAITAVLAFSISSLVFPVIEAFFWSCVVLLGSAALLVPQRKLRLREKLEYVGRWDFIAPSLLILFSLVHEAQVAQSVGTLLRDALLRLAFLFVFFAGLGASLSVHFGVKKRQ